MSRTIRIRNIRCLPIRRRLFVCLIVSSVVCSEVSIYAVVDTYRCVDNGQHPYLLPIRPDGHDPTLTFRRVESRSKFLAFARVCAGRFSVRTEELVHETAHRTRY
jgi:hypothetical protein